MDDSEEIKEARKKASQIGVLLGGIALVVGALICFIYLIVCKPWKIPGTP